MKIQVLVSTMGMNREDIREFVKNMNIKTDAIIVNQCKEDSGYKTIIDNNTIDVYSYNEIGLSNSRNRCLEKVDSDVAIIADDNMQYVDNYPEIITEAYNRNPNADIIAFNIIRENDDRETKNTTKKISYINSMRISSSQITFKTKSILDNKLRFDSTFGSRSILIYGRRKYIFI